VPGAYLLRFALVKEGVAWFPPSNPLSITALAGFVAVVTPPTLPSFIAGGTYDVPVTLKNTGAAAWNATGPNLVDVSYHWIDAAGNTVIWDGTRTPLAANVDPGASANVTLKVGTPQSPGTYTLAIDLVRDIHRSGITLVIVEHIMEVIMSLASRVVVFHQGKEIARGSPREVTANPAVIAAYLGTRAAKAAAGHTPIELMGGPAT